MRDLALGMLERERRFRSSFCVHMRQGAIFLVDLSTLNTSATVTVHLITLN